MPEPREPPDNGEADEIRSQFLNSLGTLRPTLHRLCARMCGSVLDGEDLVRETLAAASYKLSPMPYPQFLERSLLRMALERCLRFVRHDLGHREHAHVVLYGEGRTRTIHPERRWHQAPPLEEVFASRVSALRPDDRVVMVLADVLGYSLRDTVTLTGTTLGYVRFVLWRGRATLRELPPLAPSAPLDDELRTRMQQYADCFNRLDGNGLHRLVKPDARVEIVGAFSGRMRDVDATYAGTYAATSWDWRLSVARVDGDPALLTSRRVGEIWQPYAAIRLWWEAGQVVRIRDYMHIRHVLRDARIEPADARH